MAELHAREIDIVRGAVGTRQLGVDVKNITYSPLGALTTFGSCAKTGHTTSRISNGAVSEVVVACTTCEFASQ